MARPAPDVVPERPHLRKRYVRHEPESSVLYQVVQAWLETFLAIASEAYLRPLPRHVVEEFEKYLRCGILAWGFARAYCRSCGASMLVAFSCKLRGVWPSCGARRASQTAANLVDRILPRVPLRQWVLSVPYELRLPMARSPALLSAGVRILCAEISRLMRRLGQERGVRQGATGMVATIQLFGGSLNLNPHAHLLVLDGVYHNDGHRAVFTETRAPTQSEIAEVTRRVQARVLRELKRRGMLRDPNDARNEAEDEPMMGCAQLSLRLGKLGRVDEHGRVQPDDMDLDARFARRGKLWCADIDGYSLHAGVTVRGDDDVGRENLCRYVLRHPIS